MKLKEKIFVITDNNGKSIDLEREKNIAVLINGENKGAELKDLFVRHELDENEIIGFSLLQYFKVTDGLLVDSEGNTVSLVIADKNILLKFKEIDVKFVPLDAIHVQVNYIEAFSYSLIGIQKPEIIFSDLSNSEKKAIVDTREEKDKAKAAVAVAVAEAVAAKEVAAAEAGAAREAAEAAAVVAKEEEEKKFKDSIHKNFVYEKKDYRNIQEGFSEAGGKEYVQDPYHFFYAPPTAEEPNPKDPTVLIKRGEDWWQEDEDGEITTETDKTVNYEFSDGQQKKIVELDVEKGTITVNNHGEPQEPKEPAKD